MAVIAGSAAVAASQAAVVAGDAGRARRRRLAAEEAVLQQLRDRRPILRRAQALGDEQLRILSAKGDKSMRNKSRQPAHGQLSSALGHLAVNSCASCEQGGTEA